MAFQGLSPAHATSYSYNGSKQWDTPSAWNPLGPPAAGDSATIGLSGTTQIELDSSSTIANLNVVVGQVGFNSFFGGPHLLTVTDTALVTNPTTSLKLCNCGFGGGPLDLSVTNLSVQNGATLQVVETATVFANSLSSSGLNGTITVDGSGSELDVSAAFTTAVIGAGGGSGALILQNGAAANFIRTSSALNSPLQISDGASTGAVTITGGSTFALGGNLNLFTQYAASTATVSIDGTNSALTQDSHAYSVTVGSDTFGAAAVNIGTNSSGATLTTSTGALTINKAGVVNVGTAFITTTGTLNAHGDVTINGGSLYVGAGSTFNLALGKTLTINGGRANFLSYNPSGINLSFIAGSLSYAGDLKVGTGGILGSDLTLASDRTLSLTGTTTIDPTHTLTVSGGALQTFALANNGTLVISSGMLGSSSMTLASSSTVQIGLGGATRLSQYGVLVGTTASLAGTLQVSLLNSYIPAVGTSFDIFGWFRPTGTFSSILLPTLTTGHWDTSQLYTIGELSVAGLAGDYNGNGVVDAADYAVWRDTLGSTTDLRANGDNTGASAGKIDQADFKVWKANFGMHAGSGSGANATAAVPEPASELLFLVGIVGMRWLTRFISAAVRTP
jgi:hypothetical protein